MTPPKKPDRLPPRMHPDDLEAITLKLGQLVSDAVERFAQERGVDELIHRIKQLERAERTLVAPLSVVHALEERIRELEAENRQLLRSQLQAFLDQEAIREIIEDKVQELREELTG